MHYVPDMKFAKSGSFYTPMNDKFAGYTQYPYRIGGSEFPEHLGKAGEGQKNFTMRKCQSEAKR